MPITLGALAFGVGTALAAAAGAHGGALLLWVCNRILDGLDGEVARARGDSSDLGGYVDMMGDVFVYAAVPLGVAYAHNDPAVTAAILVMISAFYVNITSWTYLSALLEKRRTLPGTHTTSIEMPGGVIEGTETIIIYGLLVALPGIVVPTALIAAAAALFSSAQRLLWAARSLRD